MLGLRTRAGVSLSEVARRTGLDLASSNRTLLAELVSNGLARVEEGHVLPTLHGLGVADGLAGRFAIP